jgi:histone acetyltransferase
MALIRKPLKVIGGICYRPFDKQEFAEIVFCAIASTEQVKVWDITLLNLHNQKYLYPNDPLTRTLGLWITFDESPQGSYICKYQHATLLDIC